MADTDVKPMNTDSQPNGDASHVDASGELTFKEIYNIVKGQPSIGTFKMTPKGIVFKVCLFVGII